jgi:hypothetical protein
MFGGSVVSFPPFDMGQYFKAVNVTKKEVVCPWCLSGFAKLWEWAANPWGAVFTLLLRKSSGSGGGDYGGPTTELLDVTEQSPEQIMETIARGVLKEGAPCGIPRDSVVGRWAGDEVHLVGDYDSSKLYQESRGFRNISEELVEVWNSFIDMDDMRLTYNPKCSCKEVEEESVRS